MTGPAAPTPFRIYSLDADLFGSDGYPAAWFDVKHLIREQAGHRCERCGHPYRVGEHGNGEWSPCDPRCSHGEPTRWADPEVAGFGLEAQWRILTVHHLNGDKADCRWWNLAALCQRCHLYIQGKVVMGRVFPFEHTGWFKPHAAGWYAVAYLGEELTREETLARLDELLALERIS